MKINMTKIAILIKFILTLALIYGVYIETGIFTAIAIALLAISCEMISSILKKIISR